jgi:cell wall-associated NlpC family hydrolase
MPAITRTARALALAAASLGLTVTALGATSAPVHAETKTESKTQTRTAAARVLTAKSIAMNQRGDGYAYGAAGPSSFDCSGLIYYSYRRAGLDVPRTSAAQAGATRRIAKQDMRAGDLMFFTGSGGVYHAAIFLGWSHGHAVMLHSPGSGQRVQVAVPWTSRWFGGTLRR